VTSLLALAAAAYVAAYAAAEAWRRRTPGRVLLICPLREAQAVPQEIVELLGAPLPARGLEALPRADVTIAFLTDAPGIALARATDESSLDAMIGPYVRGGAFTPALDWWREQVGRGRWTAGLLFDLALEVLHRQAPRSLVVDFRPPPPDETRALGVPARETDLDLAIYAYELRCRLRRYSRYRDTPCELVFCGVEGVAWRLSG
jgi:hypothetical protein